MNGTMRKPPKYCQGFVDRHGRPRWYFRRPGFDRVPLPGLPWSPDFMAAYEAAMEGKSQPGEKRTVPGTVSDLIVRYYQTPDFKGLSDSTKATYRGIIESFRAQHGGKRVAKLRRDHVRKIVGAKSDTPAAANNLLRMIRMLMQHAMDMGMIREDPTAGIRAMKRKATGFTAWEEEHISVFLDCHAPGTRANLALHLLLYTGQRRSDVVRMGRQHIKNGVLSVTQQKTGTEVTIPLHGDLISALGRAPRGQLAFLTTAQGKPFTPAGFTNWFRDMVREAGLPDGLSPHGLRKATCRRLAEAGCSPHEIMAISGHKTLSEVTRYTDAANRKNLAKRAMESFGKIETRTKTVKPGRKV